MTSEKQEQEIEEAYMRYNCIGAKRLFKLMQNEGSKITEDEIKSYLDKQEQEQIFKPPPAKRKKDFGSITSLMINETWQIDIFCVFNFVKDYKFSPFKYAFCAIDIFSRKAYGIPMKNKDIVNTSKAMQQIIKQAGQSPYEIMSDQDSSFLGDQFQEVLNEHNISFNPYIKGDHNALGIIDSFAKRLKLAIAKYIVMTHNKETWFDIMDIVIRNYNETPNTSLNNIKPNEANEPKNKEVIFNINLEKRQSNKRNIKLKQGDTVRLKIEKEHKKSSDPQFSDDTYKIKWVDGSTITLDNGKKYKINSVSKVVPIITSNNTNPINENIKAKNVNRELKNIDQEDIILTDTRKKRTTAGSHSERLNL